MLVLVPVVALTAEDVSIICFNARICSPPHVRLIPPTATTPLVCLPVVGVVLSLLLVVVVVATIGTLLSDLDRSARLSRGRDGEDAVAAEEAVAMEALTKAAAEETGVEAPDLRCCCCCTVVLLKSGDVTCEDRAACLRRCCWRMLCSVGGDAE